MSHLLHPPVLDDFGAVAAIESIAEKYRTTSELDVRVTAPDATVRFAPPIGHLAASSETVVTAGVLMSVAAIAFRFQFEGKEITPPRPRCRSNCW